MASFRSDKIVFGVGFLGTLLIFAGTLHSAVKETEREIHCWAPSHFSHAHVEYTNQICEYEENRNPDLGNFSDHRHNSGSSQQTRASACSLAYYGIQAVLVFISYYILSSITSTLTPAKTKSIDGKNSDSKEGLAPLLESVERTSCSIMISYLLTQALTAILLVGFGARSLAESPSIQQANEKNHTFLCDFDIRKLGSIMRFTVQCVEDEEEGNGPITLLMKGAPYLNAMLCMVLAVMILVHVITMICCGTRTRKLMVGAGDKQQMQYEVQPHLSNTCISDATLEAALARENGN